MVPMMRRAGPNSSLESNASVLQAASSRLEIILEISTKKNDVDATDAGKSSRYSVLASHESAPSSDESLCKKLSVKLLMRKELKIFSQQQVDAVVGADGKWSGVRQTVLDADWPTREEPRFGITLRLKTMPAGFAADKTHLVHGKTLGMALYAIVAPLVEGASCSVVLHEAALEKYPGLAPAETGTGWPIAASAFSAPTPPARLACASSGWSAALRGLTC